MDSETGVYTVQECVLVPVHGRVLHACRMQYALQSCSHVVALGAHHIFVSANETSLFKHKYIWILLTISSDTAAESLLALLRTHETTHMCIPFELLELMKGRSGMALTQFSSSSSSSIGAG